MSWNANDAVLAHSAKGTHWSKKDHKYIRKEGNRYIYKEDQAGSSSKFTIPEIKPKTKESMLREKLEKAKENAGAYNKANDIANTLNIQYAQNLIDEHVNSGEKKTERDTEKDKAQKSSDNGERLGGTDYFAKKRDDGSIVISEEDMEWVLPAGTNLSEVTKKLEAADDFLAGKRARGEDYDNDYYVKYITAVLKGGNMDEFNKKKLSVKEKRLSHSDTWTADDALQRIRFGSIL